MTKRRKLYQEKCRAKQLRTHRATDYVMRGLDPYIASKHFAIFDEGIKKNLAMLHIPKEKSWKQRWDEYDKLICMEEFTPKQTETFGYKLLCRLTKWIKTRKNK